MEVTIANTTICITPVTFHIAGILLVLFSSLLFLIKKRRSGSNREQELYAQYKPDAGYPVKGVYISPIAPGTERRKPESVPCQILGEASFYGRPYYKILVDNDLVKVPADHVRAQNVAAKK